MIIAENLKSTKKVEFTDFDFDVIYDALREMLDNEDMQIHADAVLDKIHELFK